MSSISYGNYQFPNPLPFVAVEDTPFFAEGTLDYINQKISLIGRFTGINIQSLNQQKNLLIKAFSTGYQTLTVDGQTFDFIQPASISFDDSNLTSILPYSIELLGSEEKAFSKYFGITSPSNSWSYQEQDDRTVTASHKVSAVGVKIDANSRLDNARAFVEANLTGFQQLSTFFSGQSGFLRSVNEEINELQGSYAVTENYIFSDSRTPINPSGIITANTQISYSRDQGVSVTVNGGIVGAIEGTPVIESMFTANDAKQIAAQAIESSRSDYEAIVYSALNKSPVSYNYNHNEISNTIDFSFVFSNADDYRADGPINNYTSSIACSRDSNNISVSINGSVTYLGTGNLYTGGAVESNPRFLAVSGYFTGIDPYALAQEAYNDFILMYTGYETGNYLNKEVIEESIVKNPIEAKIDYNYTYSNRIQLSTGLKNCEVTISDSKPIQLDVIKNGMNGFVSQTVVDQTLGIFQVDGTSLDKENELSTLRSIVDSIINGNTGIDQNITFQESNSVAVDSISYSISKYYNKK